VILENVPSVTPIFDSRQDSLRSAHAATMLHTELTLRYDTVTILRLYYMLVDVCYKL